ncbi:phage antirepressor N-terminal domain-containing protein [Xanthobacter sp. VTT E-85241]|uniref:phage antirepressor N-terminal domain-containing protein n=1 Tax=Roseixanthobacter finlandensis TaxID=3119922 RepID=UPI0037270446
MTAHALALIQVEFHGDTLFAVERDGAVFIAIKPICDALGLVWRKQQERIRRDPILSQGITMVVIPSPGGPQETTLLRLDLVHGWLFTIDEGRVKDEETRRRVLLYKRECYRALFSHFFGERGGHHDGVPFEGLEGEGVLNVRTASASEDFGPLSDLSARCRMVEITERLSGKSAARALWRHLGLPWVGEMDPSGAILAEADDAVARFAVEGIERVRGVVTPAAMLLPAFSAFCKRRDLANPGENSFLTRFGRMGFAKRKIAGRSVYQNIRPRCLEESAGDGAS